MVLELLVLTSTDGRCGSETSNLFTRFSLLVVLLISFFMLIGSLLYIVESYSHLVPIIGYGKMRLTI